MSDDFYTDAERANAAQAWPEGEVAAAFARYRRCVDESDHAGMAGLLSPDGRGGNAVYGMLEGPAAYLDFCEKYWPSEVPNESVWIAIDGGRVVNRWRETLPGTPPDGVPYTYDGITEVIYAGEGRFSLIWGVPDLAGFQRAMLRWQEHGQAERYPDVFPSA